MQYVVLTFEAAFPCDSELTNSIQSTLDVLRGYAAARAVASRVLTDDNKYDTWHKDPGIHEVEIPIPTVIRFD